MLRPVLPSRFETVPPSAVPVLEPSMDPAAQGREAMLTPSRPVDRKSAPEQDPFSSSFPDSEPGTRRRATANPRRSASEHCRQREIDTIGMSHRRTAGAQPQGVAPAITSMPGAKEIAEPTAGGQGAQRQAHQPFPAIPVEKVIQPARIVRSANVMAEQVRVASPVAAGMDEHPSSFPGRTERSDNVRPRSSARTPPPEPSVHVTIGRIEVRAVMQPSPPAKTNPPPRPKLSLDDYLKQRDEVKP